MQNYKVSGDFKCKSCEALMRSDSKKTEKPFSNIWTVSLEFDSVPVWTEKHTSRNLPALRQF